MEAAMPCKVKTHQYRETCGESDNRKSKHACVGEARESTRKRLERTPPTKHEHRIAGKGFNSLSHHNLAYKTLLLRQAMKSSDAKAAVDKEWEKLEQLSPWQMTRVKSKKEVIQVAQKEKRTVHFCFVNGHLSSPVCGVGTEISETQRPGRAPRRHCERRFRLTRSIHGAGFICISNDGRKSNGCHCKTTRMCRTSSRRSLSLHSSQNGGRFRIAQQSQSQNVQTYGHVFHDTNGRNRGHTLKIQWYFLNEICTNTHLLVSCRKDSSKKFYWNLDGKSTDRKQGLFLSVHVDDIKMAGKKHEYGSHVEEIDEKRGSWWTHIISWPCIFGMYSTWMQTERNHYWTEYKDVWITYFCWSNWKVTRVGKTLTQRRWRGPTTWKDMLENALRDTANLANKKVEQLYAKFQAPCVDDHQFKQEELESVGELSQVCSQIVSKCLVPGTNWGTRHSMVCQQACKSSYKMDSGLRQTIRQDSLSYIHTKLTSGHIVMWVTRLSIVDWVYFKTQTLLATLRTRNQPQAGVLCIFGSRTCCLHQLDVQEANVSNSSTAQFLSFCWMLDCDWMDWLALDLWNVVIEVLRSTNNTARQGRLAARKLVQDRRPFQQ